MKCYNCGLSGHIAKDRATSASNPCQNKPEVKSESGAEKEGRAESGEGRRRACVSLGLTSQFTSRNSWIVDSGASRHITSHSSHKEWFSDFSDCDGDVKIGKGYAEVTGCGTVEVEIVDKNRGYTLILSKCFVRSRIRV